MRATVSPGKLRETFGAKLGTAAQALHKLREADKPRFTRYSERDNYYVEFLHASRGVVPIAETFAGAGFEN
jgi:hypothetical protein